MDKEFKVLKVVKEDILRILGEERDKRASIEFINLEIDVSDMFLFKAIKELEEKDLIQSFKNYIFLTEKGRDKAKKIIKKHLILENYFRERRNEKQAHKAAHILEHYVSRRVIEDIEKISTFRKEDVSLATLGKNKESIITDLVFSNYALFERVVSMGLSLGKKVKIVNKISNGFIVKTRSKKFALDKNIVRKIMVYPLNYEKA